MELVSKNFGTEKSLGIGLKKFWYKKKSQNRYRSDFGSRHTLAMGKQILQRQQKHENGVNPCWSKNVTHMGPNTTF